MREEEREDEEGGESLECLDGCLFCLFCRFSPHTSSCRLSTVPRSPPLQVGEWQASHCHCLFFCHACLLQKNSALCKQRVCVCACGSRGREVGWGWHAFLPARARMWRAASFSPPDPKIAYYTAKQRRQVVCVFAGGIL